MAAQPCLFGEAGTAALLGGRPRASCVCAVAFMWSLACAAAAWTSEAAFEAAAVKALATPAVLTSVAFTNDLEAFMQSAPSSNALWSAQLIEVVSRLEQFEQTHDEGALGDGLALASNRVQTVGHDCWQGMAARLLLAGGLCLAGDDARAFSVATNALAELDAPSCEEGNDALAQALLRYHDAEGLSLRQTVRAFAALTAAKCGDRATATNLVQTLPVRYREMASLIISARGGDGSGQPGQEVRGEGR